MPFDGDFVVQGMTMEGEVFQPQDWAQELCAEIEKNAKNGRSAFPAYLHPVLIGGVHSLVVLSALKDAHPDVFDRVKAYIAEHRLVVRAGRGGAYIETTGVFPAYGKERRDPSRNNW